MKRGDIVKMKPDSDLSSALFFLQGGEREQVQRVVTSNELTVASTGEVRICCIVYDVVYFEEVAGTYFSNDFEVLLEAGEPDLTELLKEKERRLAYVGF